MKYRITTNQGYNSKLTRIENQKAIEEFFKSNPEGTRRECAEKTGLHYGTICRHLKEMSQQESN